MTREILRECFDKNQCDKGSKHHYEYVYYPILDELIENKKKTNKPLWIMEIGIYKGAGVQSFIDYFDSGLFSDYYFMGLDTFQRCPPEKIPVLERKHVGYRKCDSTDPEQFEENNDFYDLIIDDGLHTPEAQMKTFQNYWPSLKSGGYYIIEDVWPLHLMDEKEQRSHWWLRKYWEEFSMDKHRALLNAIGYGKDNCLGIDHRPLSKEPDSFCFQIRKD